MTADSPPQNAAKPPPRVSLFELWIVFLRIGLTSFGGSTSAWMHREIVERRGLLDDQAFMTGLTVAQVLPGANPVNLSLYIGLQARGGIGATVAVFGMVLPAFCVILMLGFLYRTFSGFTITHVVLGGMAAAGLGATLTMGLKLARRVLRQLIPVVITLFIFVTVGLLRWPMVPVILVITPLSIGLALFLERRDARV